MSAIVDADALLENLTPPQLEAVTHADGPLLILAGPGSGKTRVITRRAAYLAATVTQPWHVLAITFTNKAANEMVERVESLGFGREMTVCTFHSLGARLLRINHEAAGLAPNFTIIDQSDRRQLLKEAIIRAELSTDNWRPSAVEGRISRAKNAMESPDAMADAGEGYRDQTIARIYRAYEEILRENAGLDFDDLLLRIALLLQEDDAVRKRLSNRYRYVMIDEYQDTNLAQYRIANLLAGEHRNILVTGDPDQSIYSWRGADIANILTFENDYAGAKVVRLEQNYRSTKRILSAADAVIARNVDRKEKKLWTENEEGSPVRVRLCDDAEHEAKTIALDIEARTKSGCDPSHFAIFYRINALSRTLEEAFYRHGIPYRIARGTAFYARKEIKDLLAYLRVMVNPADAVALERIVNTPPRGIGKTTIGKLKNFASAQQCTLYEAVTRASECGVTKRAEKALGTFVELMEALQPLVEGSARTALEQTLSLSGMYAMLTAEAEAITDPLENAQELVNAAADFDKGHPDGTLLDWLTFTSLVSDVDGLKDGSGAVTMMTLHAAKGLEFPHVYIIGLEHGLLPLVREGDFGEEDEEERRLFFVGMTRAMKSLTLTHAEWRQTRGSTLRKTRSGFLDELPADEVEWGRGQNGSTRQRQAKVRASLPDEMQDWEVGTLVRHTQYGLGRIMAFRREAQRTHVNVRFEDGRDECWALEFADLVRVDFDDVG